MGAAWERHATCQSALKGQWLLYVPATVTVKKLSVLPTQCINVFLTTINIKVIISLHRIKWGENGIFKYYERRCQV